MKKDMIPYFIRKAKGGDILATKYGHLLMVEHVDIDKDYVRIYFYFNYKDDKLFMNEWLTGFYGPKFTDDFYRPATTEEHDKFIYLMVQYGYELIDEYGKLTPRMTLNEFRRKYK